jgi:hypothetical protein
MPTIRPCEMTDCKHYQEYSVGDRQTEKGAMLIPEVCRLCACWRGVELYEPKKRGGE